MKAQTIKLSNNNYNNKFDILNLQGTYKIINNKYYFDLINSDSRQKSDEIYEIADPSNDQTFKILFNGTYTIKKISEFDRAISLIKSLLFKFPNNKEIKTLSYWPNEIPEVSGHNRKKLKVVDCPFLCEMNDGSKYIINLEMQNYNYNGLDLNALTYGTSLRNASGLPVIIIVLLIAEADSYNSFEIIPFKKLLNSSEFKQIDDYVYVICFDLCYIVQCMDSNIEPELNGFKISREGKEWIKLLTIKEWMRKSSIQGKIKRYPLPKNLKNSKEIISAINILNSKDNSHLMSIVLKEKTNDIINEDLVNREFIKVWIKGFLKGKTLDNTIIEFPDVAPEYLIKICKSLMDKNKCNEFLKMLIDNEIIDSKNIYSNLVNQIYE